MAGIDKIRVNTWDEYVHLEEFCAKHNSAFFKKHHYYLSEGLYDGITPDFFTHGLEFPISNFRREADIYIIQNLSEREVTEMPQVIAYLRQQYSDFDLIREHKSEFDTYQIDRSGCRVNLQKFSTRKTLKHLKREKWDLVWIDIYFFKEKNGVRKRQFTWVQFDGINKCIYDVCRGCRYYKYVPDQGDNFLHNVTMKQIYRYITQTRLRRGVIIKVYCRNLQRNTNGQVEGFAKKANYQFEVTK